MLFFVGLPPVPVENVGVCKLDVKKDELGLELELELRRTEWRKKEVREAALEGALGGLPETEYWEGLTRRRRKRRLLRLRRKREEEEEEDFRVIGSSRSIG